jgi:hypothetical protein
MKTNGEFKGSGKLSFAYNTISKLEAEVNKQREINLRLSNSLGDLLEALKALLPESEIMINTNHPAHIKAIAAINKALGNTEKI